MCDRLVTSYPNPDTDGTACAVALARLLSLEEGRPWRPALLGRLGEEPRYALAQAGIQPPGPADLSAARAIALVDTHHLAQLPPDFPAGRVTLIVDHHPGGDDDAFPNARIVNRPVGAAATLIARRWLERPDAETGLLRLLAFAIASNTLYFSAPSACPLDREVYDQLVSRAPLAEEQLRDMFARRTRVLEEGLRAALLSDLKRFDSPAHGLVGLAQLEGYDLLALVEPEQAAAALADLAQELSLPLLLFNGVDFRAGRSLVVCANEASRRLAQQVLDAPFPGLWQTFDRILLRKTDFLPRLS